MERDELQRLHDPKTRPYSELTYVGIAIRNINNVQHHMGALYKKGGSSAGEDVLLLHLHAHDDVKTEELSANRWEPYLWVELPLPPQLGRAMRRICARVSAFYGQRGGRGISFAISYSDSRFDGEGRYSAGMDRGLTCATFVLALFRSRGILLLRQEEWPPRDEDKLWQKGVAEYYSKGSPWLLEQVDGIRFRPEEVAASGLAEQLPVGFADAERLGRRIVEQLAIRWNAPGT